MKSKAPLLIGLSIFCFLSAGCMTNAGIGAVSYEDSGFVIPIDLNEGEDVLVQIMIYDVGGLHQEEEQLILESFSIRYDQSTVMSIFKSRVKAR